MFVCLRKRKSDRPVTAVVSLHLPSARILLTGSEASLSNQLVGGSRSEESPSEEWSPGREESQ